MFFRFILFTVLAYFIFKWLDRLMGGGKSKSKESNQTRKSGSSASPKSSKSIMKDDVGEYVDFEEVKEKDSKD